MIKHNKFNQEWVELLTNNNVEEELEFYEITKNSPSLILAIMYYRRQLREKGRGNISIEQLKSNINNKKELQNLLQLLFLEPIPASKVDLIKENNIEKLYSKYKENENRRFMNAILSI
ncbi:MAG: hypothetical protein M0Q14_08750 [Tissierellaceae bacterium]|nr:hypothetical protein [Tissierellaceae bacterium]